NNATIEVGREFFYLDFSLPFNTQNLLWQDLTNINIIPTHAFAATVKGGVDNNTLIFYGGRNLTNAENMALVYMFDTQSNSWHIPSISGVSYTKRRSLSAFIDVNKKMYLFGGYLIGSNVFVNDMLILDTVNLSWGIGSSLNAPIPRINYGAVLLPSQEIIYLGLDDQQIIIFGGKNENNISITDSLYTLNLSTFRWKIPNVSGKLPTSRFYHKANVIGKYMVISFGSDYNSDLENNILLLDISNNEEYKWTTVFDPLLPSSSLSPLPSPIPTIIQSIPVMIGIIIGSLFCGSLLTIGFFLLYKHRQGQNNAELRIPGDNMNNERI
ncbi:6169_t:CDS:2, partial [Funneliformis caledonium]